MQKILLSLLTIAFGILFFGCKESSSLETVTKEVRFSISLDLVASENIRRGEVPIDKAIISIETSEGEQLLTLEEIELFSFGSSYITTPIPLETGEYSVTQFLISDDNDSILFATPIIGSSTEHLVSQPLPFNFTIAENEFNRIELSVVSVGGISLNEFGYSSFAFDIVNPLAFLMSTIAQSTDSETGYDFVTDATITISGDGNPLYQGVSTEGFFAIAIDTLDSDDNPYSNYLFTISSILYEDTMFTYTHEELRTNTIAPLSVMLNSSIPTEGLVAYYPFNGDASDESSNDFDGVLVDSPLLVDDRNLNSESAFQFGGANSHITTSTEIDQLLGSGATFSSWIYLNSEPVAIPYTILGNRNLIGAADDCNERVGFFLRVFSGSKLRLEYSTDGNDVIAIESDENILTTNTWHHITGTWDGTLNDGSGFNLYVDGQLQNKTDVSLGNVAGCGGFLESLLPFIIGNGYDTSGLAYPFDGSIDEVRIYSRVLTEEEINVLADQ